MNEHNKTFINKIVIMAIPSVNTLKSIKLCTLFTFNFYMCVGVGGRVGGGGVYERMHT